MECFFAATDMPVGSDAVVQDGGPVMDQLVGAAGLEGFEVEDMPSTPTGAHHSPALEVQGCSSPLANGAEGPMLMEAGTQRSGASLAGSDRSMKMRSREDIVAFGGIQDPTVMAPRSSDQVRAQPNVDATQLERAVLLANKNNALDMSGTKSKSKSMLSILSLSDDEIISRASKLGVSLGSSDTNQKKPANVIKKLESDRWVILLTII
jgi:hypothetical protein